MISKKAHSKLLILFVSILLILIIAYPLMLIFLKAFGQGLGYFFDAIRDFYSLQAIYFSLKIVILVVPINMFFGFVVAWCLTKFNFYGKSLLSTIIDIPFSISPIIVGFMFLLLFGSNSYVGRFFNNFNISIMFSYGAVVLVSLFVTLPLIVRELVPLMLEIGNSEEEAAMMLGVSGTKILWHVTIPNVKYGIIIGVIMTIARSLGEFGAAAIVSGHIKGKTNTIPLHIESLYSEYNFTAAYALASLLAFLSIIMIIAKNIFLKKAK